MSESSLSSTELEQRLEAQLADPLLTVPSWRGTVEVPAADLAALPRAQQEQVLAWVGRLAVVNEEIGYQFALRARRALELMSEEAVGIWLGRIMDAYDVSGLVVAMQLLKGMENHVAEGWANPNGLALREVERVLAGFVGGLAGRYLAIATGPVAYTDTETAYLPEIVAAFDDKEDNFRLYKAMAAHLWAQSWYGTFADELPEQLARFEDPERAAEAFHALERLRLDARLAEELPGLYRQMRALRERAGDTLPEAWQGFQAQLSTPEADVQTSLALLEAAYRLGAPPPVCYQGGLQPAKAAEVRAKRLAREKEELRRLLVDVADDLASKGPPQAPPEKGERPPRRFRAEVDRERHDVRLFLDDRPLVPPESVKGLLGSVLQDLGEIPPEYLVAAGEGSYAGGCRDGADRAAGGGGGLLYPEWNHHRQSYHKSWCTLREVPVTGRDDGFVRRTREKHAALIKHLRRSFEALRGGERRLKRQPDGDDVDIDALVEAHAEATCGMEMSEHLFTRRHKVDRDIAVIFLVDMSGSTKGWINEAERESLILLCEALETLGDRYGIYGFSGMTRIRCEVYPIKRIDEPYDETVRGRISAIEPKDYTRMGAAIRHVSRLLGEMAVKTRLLVTLSDGKPDDFDAYYRGDYGIEDTRQALIEAKRIGIHPFCITIDEEGPDYLPHMYGPVNYTVIDEVRKLPLQVADIYRRLTT